ncbi:MAG: Rab family GTPase [Candidatus Thorarchaeota archaeon]|jgi:GTPase SAR1 family protein
MIIPGTTISLTLAPTYVEVRDKGLVKKKIPLKEKSFDDVALELKKYLRYLGKRLAPGVLEEVLDRIGLPRARRLLKEELIEPPKKPEPTPVVEEPIAAVEPEKPEKKRRSFRRKKPDQAATFVESPGVSADEKGEITVDDFDDIADALHAVETLSDSFMTGAPKEKPVEKKKVEISINLAGSEEIVASGKSYARVGEPPKPEEEVPEEAEEVEPEEIEIVAETVPEEVEPTEEPETVETPAHQIKPIVECKALLLGEDGVGKESLKAKANVVPITLEDEFLSEHIFGAVIEGKNHRIDLRVWSFDLAVKAKVQRKEFYKNSQVLMIVYSASDRWSFESIDFWLREATLSTEEMPPIVIVANKIDLRSEAGEDSGDEPVGHDEGFKFAEELAQRYGKDDVLHPVAFIETSCVTGEGVEEVFNTAAQLFENTI